MNWPLIIARKVRAKNEKSFAGRIIFLAICSVAISCSIMIITFASITGFKNGITNKVIGLTGDILIQSNQNIDGAEPNPLPDTTLNCVEKIRKNSNVFSVSIVAAKPCIVKGDQEMDGMVAKGVDSRYDFSFFLSHLVKGKLPNFESDSNVALISSATAKRMNLDINNNIKAIFYAVDLEGNRKPRAIAPKIVGIFNTGIEDFDKGLFITSRKLLKRVMPAEETFTHLEIRLKNNEPAFTTKLEINENINNSLMNSLTAREYKNDIFSWLDILNKNVQLIIIIMTIVACINMSTAFLILITERTNMIGLLKTFGAKNNSILLLFLFQAMRIIAIGLLFGNIIGIGICLLQQKYGFIKLNEKTYYLDKVLIEFEWWHIPVVNILCIVICIVVLLLPGQMISRLNPIKTVRFQ